MVQLDFRPPPRLVRSSQLPVQPALELRRRFRIRQWHALHQSQKRVRHQQQHSERIRKVQRRQPAVHPPHGHRPDLSLLSSWTQGAKPEPLHLQLICPAQCTVQLPGLSGRELRLQTCVFPLPHVAFHRLYFKILSHETILHIHTRPDTYGMCHTYGLHGGRRRGTPNAISRRGMD